MGVFCLGNVFFLVKLLILGEPLTAVAKVLFIVGPVLIILFSKPKKNIVKGLGLGFLDLLANVMNTFSDIMSYIRLFALGLVTVAIADAFNLIAINIGFNQFVTGLISTFILLLGHSLNIVLCCLSVLVHGTRLNILEFSGHLNIEWKGFKYSPFKKIKTAET